MVEVSEDSITSVQKKEGRYDLDVHDNERIGSIGDHKTFRFSLRSDQT